MSEPTMADREPPMPLRPFRIPDRIYFAAKERAADEGTTVSTIVRNALDGYGQGATDPTS